MKRSLTLAVAALFAAGTAYASHCPKDMKLIDDALAKNPKLSEAQMKDVKAQRAKGEEMHKAGKHADAETALHSAMKTLKIEHPQAAKK
jgi:hypothetical protein